MNRADMNERCIFVPGVPIAQGSMKIVPGGRGGRGRLVPSGKDKKMEAWRNAVTKAAMDAGWHHDPILIGPVRVVLNFMMPRPLYHFGTGRNAGVLKVNAPSWVDKRPDLDKLVRAVGDALTAAGVWRDDSQVAAMVARKRYAATEQSVGVRITVQSISKWDEQ